MIFLYFYNLINFQDYIFKFNSNFIIITKKDNLLVVFFGAGSGNRTHLSSLEGWSITDIRYPHIGAKDGTRTRNIHLGKVALYH